jgi:hypothetical protein
MGDLNERGYAIIPSVLSPAECESLIDALQSAEGRAGTRHLMSHPQVRAIAHDEPLRAIAGGAMPFRATLFNKTSKANWLIPRHQDTALPLAQKIDNPQWGPWSQKSGIWYAHAPEWALKKVIALRIHLDASTSENGPLRVIPGSHHCLLTGSQVDMEVAANTAAVIDCLVPRGGVLAMRPLILHASSKIEGKAEDALARRVLHIEYANSLQFDAGIELANA